MVYSIQTYCVLEEMMAAATNKDYVTLHVLDRSLGENSLRSKRDREFYLCRQAILQASIDPQHREMHLADAKKRLCDVVE